MTDTPSNDVPSPWRPFQISAVLHGLGLFVWLLLLGLLALSYTADQAPLTSALVRPYPVVVLIVHAISFWLIRNGNGRNGNLLLALPLLWGCGMLFSFGALAASG